MEFQEAVGESNELFLTCEIIERDRDLTSVELLSIIQTEA